MNLWLKIQHPSPLWALSLSSMEWQNGTGVLTAFRIHFMLERQGFLVSLQNQQRNEPFGGMSASKKKAKHS